jgi:hypothetical protein
MLFRLSSSPPFSSFNWDLDPDKMRHFREEFEADFDETMVDINLLIGMNAFHFTEFHRAQ